MEKRVFISASFSEHLDERRRKIKDAILSKIVEAGYQPQEFFRSGICENWAWSFDNVHRVMQRCIGAAILGFPRSTILQHSSKRQIVGEFNHYEGAVALTLGLPVLIIVEEGVEDHGVVWSGGGRPLLYMPKDADADWLADSQFARRFDAWLRELAARKDVFLGYCSKSSGIAAQIQLLLEKSGATVLNWAMDFRAGGSILSEIENARAACSCGIFLFSEDDPLEGSAGVAAPRDNVVFEAGYFMSSKGPERCLIVRYGEAKMPADVGGALYIHLKKDASVDSIEGRLNDFVKQNI